MIIICICQEDAGSSDRGGLAWYTSVAHHRAWLIQNLGGQRIPLRAWALNQGLFEDAVCKPVPRIALQVARQRHHDPSEFSSGVVRRTDRTH